MEKSAFHLARSCISLKYGVFFFFAEVDKKVDIDPTLPKDESATGNEGSASPFEASPKSPASILTEEAISKTPSDTGSYTTQAYQLG